MKKGKSSSRVSAKTSEKEPSYIRELNRVWAKDKKTYEHEPYGTVDLNEIGKAKNKANIFDKIACLFSNKKQTVETRRKTFAVEDTDSGEPKYIRELNIIWAKDKKTYEHEPYGTVDLNEIGKTHKNIKANKPKTEKKSAFYEKTLVVLRATGSVFAKIGLTIAKVAVVVASTVAKVSVVIASAVARTFKNIYKKLRKFVLKMSRKTQKNKTQKSKKKNGAKGKRTVVNAFANKQQTRAKAEKKAKPEKKKTASVQKQSVVKPKHVPTVASTEVDEPEYIKALHKVWSKDKGTNGHEAYGTVDLDTIDGAHKKEQPKIKAQKSNGKMRNCAICGKVAGIFKVHCAKGGFKLAIGIAAIALAICFFVPVKTINNVKGSEASYDLSFASIVDDMRITAFLSEINEQNETAKPSQNFGGYIAFITVIHVALAACGVWLIHSGKTEQMALFANGACMTAYILMLVWTNLGASTLGISALGVIVMVIAFVTLAAMFVYQIMYCNERTVVEEEAKCEIEA